MAKSNMDGLTAALNNQPEAHIKLDPEVLGDISRTPPNAPTLPIKYEDLEDKGVDATIPEAPDSGDDGFDDVDDSYEGMAEDKDGNRWFICKEMKIKQVPKSTIVNRYLGDLYAASRTQYMDLEPEYQREVVWDEHRASELIKSIFIGYFIPPIIFNVISKTEDVGKGKKEIKYYRICVDGKQRLTSVQKFMEGKIGFSDNNHPPKKWYYRHPIVNGEEKLTSHNIMSEAMKLMFRQSTFCCYEYNNLSLDIEETMFQLVQRGIALTPAEKMKAMSTGWAQFTKKFEDDYPIVINLSKQSRASGFRIVLTIFTMIQEVMAREGSYKGGVPTLQSSPQALQRVLNDSEPIGEGLKFKFKQVFDRYEALVKKSSYETSPGRWKILRDTAFDPAPAFLKAPSVSHVKTFSPLELISAAILVAKHMGQRSDELLIGDIKEMRIYLRENHKDLRVNAQCWVTAWEFMDSELIRRRGGIGGTPISAEAKSISDTNSNHSVEISSEMLTKRRGGSSAANHQTRSSKKLKQ